MSSSTTAQVGMHDGRRRAHDKLTTPGRLRNGGLPAIRYRSSRHIFRIFAAAKFPPNSLCSTTARIRYLSLSRERDTDLHPPTYRRAGIQHVLSQPLLYNFMDWQSWVKHQSTIKKRLRHDNGLQQFRCINSWRFRYDVHNNHNIRMLDSHIRHTPSPHPRGRTMAIVISFPRSLLIDPHKNILACNHRHVRMNNLYRSILVTRVSILERRRSKK